MAHCWASSSMAAPIACIEQHILRSPVARASSLPPHVALGTLGCRRWCASHHPGRSTGPPARMHQVCEQLRRLRLPAAAVRRLPRAHHEHAWARLAPLGQQLACGHALAHHIPTRPPIGCTEYGDNRLSTDMRLDLREMYRISEGGPALVPTGVALEHLCCCLLPAARASGQASAWACAPLPAHAVA